LALPDLFKPLLAHTCGGKAKLLARGGQFLKITIDYSGKPKEVVNLDPL